MAANAVTVASIPEDVESTEVYVPQLRARPLLIAGTNLIAVAATGAGPSVYTADKGMVQWICRASAVTTGGVVLLQGCDKDSGASTDWYTIATFTVSASGSQYAVVTENETHRFMRTNLTSRTDGTYTTTMLYKEYPGQSL